MSETTPGSEPGGGTNASGWSSSNESVGDTPGGGAGQGSGGWSSGEPGRGGGTGGPGGSASRSEWVGQLQTMIDNLATTAAPVIREIGAKAAELAALAGEKAGPLAHRAADATAVAGAKVAERGREVAAELRREMPHDGGEPGGSGTTWGGSGTSGSADAGGTTVPIRTEPTGTSGFEPPAGAESDPGNPRPGSRPDSADTLGE